MTLHGAKYSEYTEGAAMPEHTETLHAHDIRLTRMEAQEVARAQTLARIHERLDCIDKKIRPKRVDWRSLILACFAVGASLFGAARYLFYTRAEAVGDGARIIAAEKSVSDLKQDVREQRTISIYNMRAIQAIGDRVGAPLPQAPNLEKE